MAVSLRLRRLLAVVRRRISRRLGFCSAFAMAQPSTDRLDCTAALAALSFASAALSKFSAQLHARDCIATVRGSYRTMQYYDQRSEPRLAPTYFEQVPVDPIGLAPGPSS